jgi:hypothetical protein
MDNSNVRIIRLKNGEDILCNLLINEDKVLINLLEPMLISTEIHFNEEHLVLTSWLPVSLIKENRSVIPITEVMCVMHPNDELIEYYNEMVIKMNSSLIVKDADDLTEEEVVQMMEVMEEIKSTKGLVIH